MFLSEYNFRISKELLEYSTGSLELEEFSYALGK